MGYLNCVVFVFSVLLITVATDAQTVKQVSFLHRHGARDEPLVIDGKLVWKFAQLTPNGITMMVNLGKLLRATYGTFVTAFDPAEYDARTGDSDRCIQSAHGVLQGFFNGTNNFTPLIKHVPSDEDWLMEFNFNFPNVIARREWRMAFQDNDALARERLTSDDIDLLANTFGPWCKKTPMLCALFAVDAIQCRISNTNKTPAALQTLFHKRLLSIEYGFVKYIYGFHPTDLYAAVGSPAYDLTNKMMRDASQGRKKVYHYSSHDVNVAAALNTFGSILVGDEDPKWFPRFGAVLALTTYTNGNISFQYAEPDQDAASTLDYTTGFQRITVRCETAAGQVYLATQCPIDDAWRYVNRTKPMVSNRYCYLRPEDQRRETDVPPSEVFQYYREHCPIEACGPNAVLDASKGYICVSFHEQNKSGRYALATSLSGVIGLVVGVCIGILIRYLLNKEKIREEQHSVVLEEI